MEKRDPPMGSQWRILLAEDNDVSQVVASAILEQKGYVVEIVSNGARAVERVAEAPFDCVLMDFHMPVMDGIEATRRIRTWEREHNRPPVPIVALTASAMNEDREKCLAAGMNHFLYKPFVAEDLYAVVERALSGGAGNAAQSDLMRLEPDAIADLLRLEAVPGTVKNIVGIFFEDTRDAIAKLIDAQGLTQAEIARVVHSLKSTFGQLGATELAGIAREAEIAARAGDTATALSLGKQIAAEYPRFEHALRSHPQLVNLLG
jgi:CheY-like chemotaxis protein